MKEIWMAQTLQLLWQNGYQANVNEIVSKGENKVIEVDNKQINYLLINCDDSETTKD